MKYHSGPQPHFICIVTIVISSIALVGCSNSVSTTPSASNPIDQISRKALDYSIHKNIDNHGFRNSLRVHDVLGFCQDGGKAEVFYLVSGVDYRDGSSFSSMATAECWHLDTGKWLCQAELPNSRQRSTWFYIEEEIQNATPPLGSTTK